MKNRCKLLEQFIREKGYTFKILDEQYQIWVTKNSSCVWPSKDAHFFAGTSTIIKDTGSHKEFNRTTYAVSRIIDRRSKRLSLEMIPLVLDVAPKSMITKFLMWRLETGL